ncbi:hypothetical protein GWI33_013066 [Rhynchophorus ferrugineus]|uniref:Uncharacterized protein n=1 Tax=Rhynchophorus ferrugineus TaxID=354439 RepID=A0A834I778_RHYFE|nr:hypothetical protein GWI33_013066 [Rhynchophorus ferrugineus]
MKRTKERNYEMFCTENNNRGIKLLNWTITHELKLGYGNHGIPTFKNNRGEGRIDTTWHRGSICKVGRYFPISGNEKKCVAQEYEWRRRPINLYPIMVKVSDNLLYKNILAICLELLHHHPAKYSVKKRRSTIGAVE